MVSIQERFLLKSGLWWRAYGNQNSPNLPCYITSRASVGFLHLVLPWLPFTFCKCSFLFASFDLDDQKGQPNKANIFSLLICTLIFDLRNQAQFQTLQKGGWSENNIRLPPWKSFFKVQIKSLIFKFKKHV